MSENLPIFRHLIHRSNILSARQGVIQQRRRRSHQLPQNLNNNTVKLGHHQGVRGGGAGCVDGDGLVGDGGVGDDVFSSFPSKPKPNDGGGGLRSRILLWEMKTRKVDDENCTPYSTASGLRQIFSNRQETERSKLGTAWPGNK